MQDKISQGIRNIIERLDNILPKDSWSIIGSVEDFCILGSRFRERPAQDLDIRIYTQESQELWHTMFPDAIEFSKLKKYRPLPKWRAYDNISNVKVEVFMIDASHKCELTSSSLICNGREVSVRHRTAADKIYFFQRNLNFNRYKTDLYLDSYKKYLPKLFPPISLL